jgi:hypothetical protein
MLSRNKASLTARGSSRKLVGRPSFSGKSSPMLQEALLCPKGSWTAFPVWPRVSAHKVKAAEDCDGKQDDRGNEERGIEWAEHQTTLLSPAKSPTNNSQRAVQVPTPEDGNQQWPTAASRRLVRRRD